MFCPNCGKEMRKGALFCPNCGYKKNSIINNILSLPKNYVYLAILAIVIVFFFIIFSILNNNHNNSKTELAKAIEKSKIVSDYSDNNTINDMDTVVFGTYVQDSVDIKDKIEWIVLEKNNDKALLMSKNIIDVKPYFSSLGSNVWGNSYLRLWLNGEFYENAFSDDEKNKY